VSLLPHRLFLLVPPWLLDPDARDFINRVEAADGDALENGVKIAYSNFIRGCKADGIWNAIKASCILAGARTLSGALVPLVGTAPTNLNFVSGDYNRRTGLVGNGSTKYLDSNRNSNADPQNSRHIALYSSTQATTPQYYIGAGQTQAGSSLISRSDGTQSLVRLASNSTTTGSALTNGLNAISRINSSTISVRNNGNTINYANTSATPLSLNLFIFGSNDSGLNSPTSARFAFYSIGEFLDLALLDARVTDLINAIAGAI